MKNLGVVLKYSGIVGIVITAIITAYNYGFMESAIVNNVATFSAPSYVAIICAIPVGLIFVLCMVAGICIGKQLDKNKKVG